MRDRTRHLLSLLGDPAVARALELCAEEERSVPELAQLTGAAANSLNAKLEVLRGYGLLEARRASGGKGRPATRWRLVAGTLLATFERAADDFARELHRDVGRRMDAEDAQAHPKGVHAVPSVDADVQ